MGGGKWVWALKGLDRQGNRRQHGNEPHKEILTLKKKKK